MHDLSPAADKTAAHPAISNTPTHNPAPSIPSAPNCRNCAAPDPAQFPNAPTTQPRPPLADASPAQNSRFQNKCRSSSRRDTHGPRSYKSHAPHANNPTPLPSAPLAPAPHPQSPVLPPPVAALPLFSPPAPSVAPHPPCSRPLCSRPLQRAGRSAASPGPSPSHPQRMPFPPPVPTTAMPHQPASSARLAVPHQSVASLFHTLLCSCPCS